MSNQSDVDPGAVGELYWSSELRGCGSRRRFHLTPYCRHLKSDTNTNHAPIQHAPRGQLCSTCSPDSLSIEDIKAAQLDDYTPPADPDPDTATPTGDESSPSNPKRDTCDGTTQEGCKCSKPALPGRSKCQQHIDDDTNSREETAVAGKEDALRYDTLTGFQRDLLTALYTRQMETADTAVNATDVLRRLQTHPGYDSTHAYASRFYPTSNRLADRGWLTITTALQGDARRRRYQLTDEGAAVIERALTRIAAIKPHAAERANPVREDSGERSRSEATRHDKWGAVDTPASSVSVGPHRDHEHTEAD